MSENKDKERLQAALSKLYNIEGILEELEEEGTPMPTLTKVVSFYRDRTERVLFPEYYPKEED